MGARHRSGWPSPLGWLFFLSQLVLVEIFDAANDVIRGDLFPPSVRDAVDNARGLVDLEAAHGFFVEPDLYDFGQRAHHVFGIVVSSGFIIDLANNVYAFLHFGVPVLVAGWVFVRHRPRFGLLRNVLILTCLLALAGYFIFPVAPPRLTTGLVVHAQAFHFHNTMPYPKNAVLVNGRPLGFNPYAAMPSLHIAWASTIAATVFLLARSWIVRLLALIYPVIMTLAIVVTANHYVMDAVGGVMTFAVAGIIAVALDRRWRRAPGGSTRMRAA